MKPKLLFQLFNPQAIGPSKDSSLLLFRILVSLSMINTHGMKKILNFQKTAAHIPDPMGLGGEISALIAIGANIVAPLFVIFGLGTRLASILILSVTLMGFFVVHGSDPWSVRDVPLIYSLAYLLIFFVGPGKYAIDQKIFNRQQS
ncbi:DoxX family protein [Gilvibacter sp.]|uniref:DoxX family protein n=1 Tax=Gilvibacter sp. TaxID=2729997 RepID=UPI0025C3C220|nr:DoxX family protein [Gilvibacter sp.]NQX77956.1 DoxX family protein [Gilvibacter sp.]